jgi:PEP-CTERM motif
VLKKSLMSAMSALILGSASGIALADPVVDTVSCHSFWSSVTAFDDCVGLNGGNTSVASANAAFAGDPTYSVEYKDNQVGPGSDTSVFDVIDNGDESVTLKFLQEVGNGSSTTVIALKFGGQGINQLGYFRFNLADFDAGEMLTFKWDPSFGGDGISHASVFSNLVTRVPEPATPLLMLVALAAVASTARRRNPVRLTKAAHP